MKTFKIHISGRVQGVGFRPFIFNLAVKSDLKGYVSNDEYGVIIVAQQTEKTVRNFYDEIFSLKPRSSEIISSEISEISIDEVFTEFYIKPTEKGIVVDIPLTPDFATCDHCEEELFNPDNPRFYYPFTTCTQCGPRYSLTEKFPFERENTSVAVFEMCPNCLHEYKNADDIRFHSQTNTCPKCGIKVKLTDNSGLTITENNEEIFKVLAEKLSEGKIAAVKNTSGYLLMCDATNELAVAELRKRKRRPTKPFAVLFPGMEEMKSYLDVKDFHEKEFRSSEAPICIIPIKDKKDLAVAQVSPNMETVGAMFPYTGMLKLVAKTFGKPLIATSGNFHGSPICSDEAEAINTLKPIADYFIHHNLVIRHPQDDSVIRFTEKFQKKIILRRSRGYAPNYFFADELKIKNKAKKQILSLGGDLKNTFSAVPNNHVYISEYIGDLANFETYGRYEKTIKSYLKIFQFQPQLIIKDQHPNYENQKVRQLFPDVLETSVQHHEAHFAAVIGEHRLWETEEKTMGVIWDGVGFAANDEIWGGEFFIYENKEFSHVAQIAQFPWILGDKMSKSPKISALSVLNNSEKLRQYFDENEWKIYIKLIEQNAVRTSSVGRLFDAAAFLSGCHSPIYFEGEAAMWFEKMAQRAYRESTDEMKDYLEGYAIQNKIPSKVLMENLMSDLEKISPEKAALNFHFTLIKCIGKIAENHQVRNICFSGGVWQNAVMVDLVMEVLGKDFNLFFHEKLSPNDENISFGQLNYYLNLMQ